MNIGVIGSGAMGSGIAQVAATAGHNVILHDSSQEALQKSKSNLESVLKKLVEKQKLTEQSAKEIFQQIEFTENLSRFIGTQCALIIEAIVENLEAKQKVFSDLEKSVSDNCIFATNTSSLSITSIASACAKPERVVGIHFFNPPPLMPLVEIIPGLATDEDKLSDSKKIIDSWGKTTVIAKDTPGFIVNRIARPYYGEAIRIYEEAIADFATIDYAMKEIGKFKMGPFELMDFIGNDVNYAVTKTVWEQMFFDSRYKPSITQKRLFEANRFGRKSGKGYYDYAENAKSPEPKKDKALSEKIFMRILSMLINEAVDALYLNIASKEDIETAMTKGVNYPKGLLHWADEIGLEKIYSCLLKLHEDYSEERYRPSLLMKRMIESHKKFF
ncbi:MAG: 3-hydroxyacyl-CoA dehydrogenase NAD-binding domain-containing protein [Bacteroidia bacterium]